VKEIKMYVPPAEGLAGFGNKANAISVTEIKTIVY